MLRCGWLPGRLASFHRLLDGHVPNREKPRGLSYLVDRCGAVLPYFDGKSVRYAGQSGNFEVEGHFWGG